VPSVVWFPKLLHCSDSEALPEQRSAGGAGTLYKSLQKALYKKANTCNMTEHPTDNQSIMQAIQREALARQNARSDRVCLDFSLVTLFASTCPDSSGGKESDKHIYKTIFHLRKKIFFFS
jgi:hypothetical protein